MVPVTRSKWITYVFTNTIRMILSTGTGIREDWPVIPLLIHNVWMFNFLYKKITNFPQNISRQCDFHHVPLLVQIQLLNQHHNFSGFFREHFSRFFPLANVLYWWNCNHNSIFFKFRKLLNFIANVKANKCWTMRFLYFLNKMWLFEWRTQVISG